MDRPQVGVEAHEAVSRGAFPFMHSRIERPCFPTVISTNPAIVVNNTLEQALALASPRILPRRSTLASTLIHSSVVVLWLLLFARAFFLRGALAWSTGIAYVVYDTLLLIFVTWKSLPLMRRTPPLEADYEQRELPSMGVIVASHNEAAVLPVTLAALLRQTHGPAQIVIADDGSTDDTAELLTQRFGLTPAVEGVLSAPS